jgi:beta-glucanase (GH16 family)
LIKRLLLCVFFGGCLGAAGLALSPSQNITIILPHKNTSPVATLQTLTLSASSFAIGDPQGTFVGNVQNTTPGSIVTFNSLSVANSLQLANVAGVWQVQVGSSAPGAAGTLTFNLVETLAGATNSPNTTSGLNVNESTNPFDPTNPAASGYSLIFSDTFPGTALNPANWCPNYPSASGCNTLGSTTNRNQISSCDPTHVTVSNGAAHLLLTNNASNGYPTDGACLNSDGPEQSSGTPMHSFQPPAGSTGAIWIESTITLPDPGDGIVKNAPSFWMNGVTPGSRICGQGWPNCGEIDVAEFYTGAPGPGNCTSYDPNDWKQTLAAVGPALARTTCTAGNYTGTHKYGVLWTNAKISYYVDGNVIFTTTNIVASSPMYLIFFNIADSRTTPGMPSTMDISSVYVWSHS